MSIEYYGGPGGRAMWRIPMSNIHVTKSNVHVTMCNVDVPISNVDVPVSNVDVPVSNVDVTISTFGHTWWCVNIQSQKQGSLLPIDQP